jgi:hypothetical protein
MGVVQNNRFLIRYNWVIKIKNPNSRCFILLKEIPNSTNWDYRVKAISGI